MANRRISPYNVEVILKPADRTVSCPGEDRCQLELIKNDYPDIMQVGRLSYGDTQHVHVGLIGTNGGCDYDCMVGLVQSGGPLAIGVGGSARWEVGLDGCISRPVWLDFDPAHMMSSRHVLVGAVAVITRAMSADGTWRVVIDRRSEVGAQCAQMWTFSQQSDDLWVSAALSDDGLYVYIVESRVKNGTVVAMAYVHAYNRFANEYQQVFSVTVPQPVHGTNLNKYHVDRNGLVAGFYTVEEHTEVEQDNVSVPCVDTGHAYLLRIDHIDDIHGDKYSLRTRAFIAGDSYRMGQSIRGHEFVTVERRITEGAAVVKSRRRHDWEADSYHVSQRYSYYYDSEQSQTVAVGALDIGTNRPYGELLQWTASRDATMTYFPDYIQYENETSVDSYSGFAGYETTTVTAGGWLVRSRAGTITSLITTSASQSAELPLPGGGVNCDGWGLFVDDPENIASTTINEAYVDYPFHFDIGAVGRVKASFMAADEESGITYSGIRLGDSDSGAWRIWRGNDQIDLSQCLALVGHTLNGLTGIYWRA